MKAQQQAFMKAMTGGMAAWPGPEASQSELEPESGAGDLEAIKAQLSALQEQLSKLGK